MRQISGEEFERLLKTIKEYERIRDNYAEHAKTEQKPKSLPWIKRRIATLQEEARKARPPAEPEKDE